MTRFHFPRETRAARLKVLLAQPGRNVQVTDEGHVFVRAEDWVSKQEFSRHMIHVLAIMQVTARVVQHNERDFTIYLEQRQ